MLFNNKKSVYPFLSILHHTPKNINNKHIRNLNNFSATTTVFRVKNWLISPTDILHFHSENVCPGNIIDFKAALLLSSDDWPN